MSTLKGGSRQWNIAMFASFDAWKNWIQTPSAAWVGNKDKVLRDLGRPFHNLKLFQEAAERIDEITAQIDLGGAFKKARLKITDNPSGVFDFGLASLGLQRLVEFYSDELAKDHPKAFEKYDVLSGIVPNVLVNKTEFSQYYVVYQSKRYILQKRQKGTTLIQRANPSIKLIEKSGMWIPENATDREIAQQLGFTSVQKKSYIEFSKKGGVIPYIDLVIPMNFLSGTTPLNSLTSVLPAVMAAKFFERAGVGTRIWTGRVIAEEFGEARAPFDSSAAPVVARTVSQPTNPIGNQPTKTISTIVDRKVPAFFQVKPVKNRSALVLLKDRNEDADYNAIGHILGTERGKRAIADTAFSIFETAGAPNSNNGTIGGLDVWYNFPATMAMYANVIGKFQNYIDKNNLWGDRARDGVYVPDKFSPTPEHLVMGASIMTDTYDVEESVKNQTLLLHNHPFGYVFWLLIDRAQLLLGEDESAVLSQIFKRLTKEGYTPDQIKDYVAYVSYSAFNLLAEDPLKSLEQLTGKKEDVMPSEYYPPRPENIAMGIKKSKSIVRSFTQMMNRN